MQPPDVSFPSPQTVEASGSIRAGLVLQLHADLNLHTIHMISADYTRHALAAWRSCPSIRIVGAGRSCASPSNRLPVVNFNLLVRRFGVKGSKEGASSGSLRSFQKRAAGGRRHMMLHPQFVSAVLNDVYGIQVRSPATTVQTFECSIHITWCSLHR
jgi:selenocysteine lyase/cysteine desulfurase